MLCPKDRKTELVDEVLSQDLPVHGCPDCKGTWIPSENYSSWQFRQQVRPISPETLSPRLDVDFVQSPYDMKAALCPECRHYLARARVGVKTPFYVERCPNCGGIWCDRGEWGVLEQLGLHATIEQLFSSEWQARVRENELFEKEQRATIDKLGPELAAQIFALAEALEDHPYGDFGVAYLMRRFDKPQADALTQRDRPRA